MLRRIADQSAVATVFLVAIAATLTSYALNHRTAEGFFGRFHLFEDERTPLPGIQKVANTNRDTG